MSPDPRDLAADMAVVERLLIKVPTERALSLWQPWASLIAIGAKWIETRSWETKYRGPLAIHAAATTKGFDTLPGDCEGTTEAGWRYGYIGRYQAAYCYRSSDEGQRGDTFLHDEDDNEPGPCPLGAVVATCTLVDCVPMLAECAYPNGVAQHLVVTDDDLQLHAGYMQQSVENQRPYGDFRPGRWAWLLEDIRPLAEPVTMRGHQGLWRLPDPNGNDGAGEVAT